MIELAPEPPFKKRSWHRASELRERLVALLCARHYEAHVGEALARGEQPLSEPGLGYGICADCWSYQSYDRLEIDHVDGASWSRRALSGIARVRKYWSEFRAGARLRALCRGCNARHLNNRWRS